VVNAERAELLGECPQSAHSRRGHGGSVCAGRHAACEFEEGGDQDGGRTANRRHRLVTEHPANRVSNPIGAGLQESAPLLARRDTPSFASCPVERWQQLIVAVFQVNDTTVGLADRLGRGMQDVGSHDHRIPRSDDAG
jgi:hypothetical protein